jgi:hypothetical protein
MDDANRAFFAAVWAAVDGMATPDQLAMLEADPRAHQRLLERLIDELDDDLHDAQQRLQGLERQQVVADFESELARLEAAYDRLTRPAGAGGSLAVAADPPGRVRLQASWSGGKIVVWAAGPDTAPERLEELSARLAAVGAPAQGWSEHAPIPLPSGLRAPSLEIPLTSVLGWLVTVGAAPEAGGEVGSSVVWLGRAAILAVRQIAHGAVVPSLHANKKSDGRTLDLSVQWVPALLRQPELSALADAMPATVAVLSRADGAHVTQNVLEAVVDAVLTDAAGRLELPAPPPVTRTTSAVAEAVVYRLNGSSFEAPVAAGAEISRRLSRWSKPVTSPDRPTLVIQLDPPERDNAWFLSVLGPGVGGRLLPIEAALADTKATKPIADEMARLERVLPVLLRAGALRRGQVYLSQAEAWELMTVTGTSLRAAGFEVRVPALSRRKPSPTLRMFTMPTGDTVVGAHQLSDVRWSAVFDDVELTAAEVARLAQEARPLVRSHGQWIELDRVDLKEAAAALAERATTTRLTGAEILRHAVGLERSPLGGGILVDGEGWATDLLHKAREVPTPVSRPKGFDGELRSYQAEALGWLGFLDAVELGGCLALDMGLGKTPTVLAHLARMPDDGPALVITPPAVVGNWAAEAARFTPSLRVVVHHGATRASADELEAEVDGADVVITTYGTAVRDIEALSARPWRRLVLDEAQAIKNPANETAQQLRRIPATMRLALTGTPIENGLGDLWAILDFTNPGLVGSRPAFIAGLSGEPEAALSALNGILVFRRTKTEPEVKAELPDKIDELDHCTMTPEQIGLYQAVLDSLIADSAAETGGAPKQGAILAAITALKQICNHPSAYQADDRPLAGRSGKLARLEEIVDSVFAAGERVLVFTHFAEWGKRLADHLTDYTGVRIACYHGGLARGARDQLVYEFQTGEGPGALVLSLKAGGTGLNLTAASHVVLYDRWWNPAVEDQARDRAWRIGQGRTVVSHRLVCPGTVDERVEEVVAGKRHIADLVLPKSSSLADLDADQLRRALGLRPDTLLTEDAV